MRLKRKTIALTFLVCIAVAIALLALPPRNNEPSYAAKPLSYWLALHEKHLRGDSPLDVEKTEQAQQAVRTIGTNALPHLVEWISYEPSHWRRKDWLWQHFPAARHLLVAPSDKRSDLALAGFGILGTNATRAIPQLEALMKDKLTPYRVNQAMFALSGMGTAGFVSLTNALANPQQISRWQLVWALGDNASDTGTNTVLPTLLAALSDQDALVRSSASMIITQIAPEALTNAPPQ